MDEYSQFLRLFWELGVDESTDKILSSHLTKIENGVLIWLDLGCTGIETLPLGVFDRFPELEYLGLYGNNISEIPPKYFFNMKSLKYLDLGENNLKDLPNDFFDEDNSLTCLWLYANEFEKLSVEPFRNLTKLQELNLNSAIRGSIDWDLFSHLPNLKRLEIALNRIEDVPLEKLPKSLTVLIKEKQLPAGGITIIDLFQELNSRAVERSPEDTFCLVTGLMGSGKSTIMKQLPYPKLDGYPPETETKIFFDNLFALKKPDGSNTIFFELDGPTILSWHQFIQVSNVVVQVVRFEHTVENLDQVIQLAEHILVHKPPATKFFLAVTYSPEDLDGRLLGIPTQLSSQIDAIFKIPPGEILPDVGGNRRVIIEEQALVELCEAIFKVPPSH